MSAERAEGLRFSLERGMIPLALTTDTHRIGEADGSSDTELRQSRVPFHDH